MPVGMEHDVAVLHRVQGGQHVYIHLRQAPAMKEITQVSRPEKAQAAQTSHDMGDGQQGKVKNFQPLSPVAKPSRWGVPTQDCPEKWR